MPMTDDEVQKQINQMVAFIEQEANEKVEEIYTKTEEEFNIEKGRIVQDERAKIMEYYAKKEKAINTEKQIEELNLLNNGRITLLTGRQEMVDELIEDARVSIVAMTQQKTRKYAKILYKLLLEALFKAMEGEVFVRCRKNDVLIVEAILPEAVKRYTEMTQIELRASVDEAVHLPASSSGGVEVIALHGRLKVENTLDSRLNHICEKLAPQIRTALFGPNKNRKFKN